MNKSLLTTGIAALLAASITLAQDQGLGDETVGESLRIADNCSHFGEELPGSVVTFSSSEEAESVIKRIVDATGLIQNFRVRAAGVPNAAAQIEGATRYILYNPQFIQETERASGTRWGPISIMAHEVGHHLNGHTLDGRGSRPKIELQADYYSGFIVQKLGGSMKEARAAMERLGSERASDTPPRQARSPGRDRRRVGQELRERSDLRLDGRADQADPRARQLPLRERR